MTSGSSVPQAALDKALHPELPHSAEIFVPHRPPMLLVAQLVQRQGDRAVVEALAPVEGFFVSADNTLLPEYYVEVVAQAMAAANGYDSFNTVDKRIRYLVGLDDFTWHGDATPGSLLTINIEKTFQFGSVTIMRGQLTQGQRLIAAGVLKVWEE